jgi:hypothetical protein
MVPGTARDLAAWTTARGILPGITSRW